MYIFWSGLTLEKVDTFDCKRVFHTVATDSMRGIMCGFVFANHLYGRYYRIQSTSKLPPIQKSLG